MSITAQEAFDRLDNISTQEEFVELLNELSIEASGDKTILYSGESTIDGKKISKITPQRMNLHFRD